jgi:hypothetical protein
VGGVDWIMPYVEIVDYKTFDVTFADEDGYAYLVSAVADGCKAEAPDDPLKQYYIFDCWLLDGEPYDFDTPVTGNITLIAKWSLVPISSLTITSAAGDPAPALITIPRNCDLQLCCIVNPEALPIGIVWSTSTPAFVQVNPETGLVTVLNKTGTALITAKAPSGVTQSVMFRIV